MTKKKDGTPRKPMVVNISPGSYEREEIMNEVRSMLDANEVKAMVTVVKLNDDELVILADDMKMYDYHAIIGCMQTDAVVRQIAMDLYYGNGDEEDD